ncbi:MAG: PKD domain-containing protein, partial [Thermoplasmata archaeon]|nr:PKD domain-containing protein [Thermoplasmata archaeon]
LVSNVAPDADFETTAPVFEGGVVDFNSTVDDPGKLDTHIFDWDFDYDGLVFDADGTRQNVSWQYYQDGEYTVALRVTDDDGASVIVTREITILNSAPEASIDRMDPFDEGESVIFTGTFNDTGRFDTDTFQWDFGDGTTSTDRSPTHSYLDDGYFTVTFNVTDDAGDFGTNTRDFLVLNVAPNATVAATPDHIKENMTVYFQAEGRDPSPLDAANLSYTWNFGDGESSNREEVFHLYVDDGCFTVTLTVQDDDGGIALYTLHVLVDNVAPSLEAGADREYIREGEVVNFTALIDDPGPLDTHTALWDFDDGTTSDQLAVTHRFLDDGNYIVVLTVTDNSGGTNTTTFRVAVSNVRPILTATANITEIDEGSEVAFTAEWTDPGELDEHTISWDFGDGTESSVQNPIHQFMQDGTYTVLVTVADDDGGQASKPFVIEVNNVAPVPTISVAITQIDENGMVQFAASATDKGPLDTVTFHWDFGDGSDPDDKYDSEPNHRYVDNGVFRVTLRAIDSDGAISSPAAVMITVNNVPPRITGAAADLTQVTVGKAVTFSALAEDDSPEDEIFYTWNFG